MLILASSSKYRQKQLSDLGLKFKALKPRSDERALKRFWHNQHKGQLSLKKSKDLAQFLAIEKAKSVLPDVNLQKDFVIGSDQLVFFENTILEKPGSKIKAFSQLKKMRGKTHFLVTAVAFCYGNNKIMTKVIVARVKMAKTTDKEILNTLNLDRPFDCAGAYKIESSGLRLIDSIQVDDFTSIVGLPVITLLQMLRKIEKSSQ